MESLDRPQPDGARDSDDILPLLITLKHFQRQSSEEACGPSMLKYLPHILNDMHC